MAITRKRSSSSASIPKRSIAQVSSTLKDLPAKPKENLSLRETIGELHDSITLALNRGYSYEEVVDILASQDINITVASLKRYLAAARKEHGVSLRSPRTRRTTNRGRSENSEDEAVLSAAETPEETESAPPRRTRQKSASSRSADAGKTAAKTRSTTKTSSRSTSSRRRK